MNNLTELQNKALTIDSREVAKIINKEHKNLLRDINTYISQMGEANKDGSILSTPISLENYFIESTYRNSQNKVQPCYLLTKLGCEFVSNKLTGVKGTAFTAVYTKKFNEMEERIEKPKYKLPSTYSEALRQLADTVEENENLHLENKQKEQIIGELKPKADYTDNILKNKGLVSITQISKDYGISGQKMNELLHDLGVQYNQSGQWLLYAKYHSKGYTHSKTFDFKHKDGKPDVKMNTKWTQKGRLFLYKLLKKNNVLPVIDVGNAISKEEII